MKGEFEFIRALRERAPVSSSVTGIGDDAAVFQVGPGKETVITTDLLVEDIDFRRTTITPYLLGHKALAVSLSDIAAMGARPLRAEGTQRPLLRDRPHHRHCRERAGAARRSGSLTVADEGLT